MWLERRPRKPLQRFRMIFEYRSCLQTEKGKAETGRYDYTRWYCIGTASRGKTIFRFLFWVQILITHS